MKKGIIKLIQYLEDKIDNIERTLIFKAASRSIHSAKGLEELIDQEAVAKNIIRILSVPRPEWNNHGEVFISFDELSELMKEAKLNSRETLDVINYIIEKNISTGITKEGANFFDGKAINTYNFTTMTSSEAENLIKTDKYRELMSKENPTELEKKMIEELEQFVTEHPAEHNEVAESHRIMEKEYFSNLDSLTAENINEYISQLLFLRLPIETAYIIKPVLEKQIVKQNVEPTAPIKLNIPKPIVKESKEEKKLRYNLEQKLKQYIDLSSMKILNELTYDELIECLSMLKRIGAREEKLNTLISNYNRSCKNKNPIIQYLELYYRYLYYLNKDNKNILENLERCFKELLMCSNDDYEVWKQMLEEYLEEMNNTIPESNEYELSLVK